MKCTMEKLQWTAVMSSVLYIRSGLLSFPFLLSESFPSFSSLLRFPQPSLLSPVSARGLAFSFSGKSEGPRGRCQPPPRLSSVELLCLPLCLPSTHCKSVVLRVWSRTSSVGTPGNQEEMQILRSDQGPGNSGVESRILGFNKPLGQFRCTCKFDNACWRQSHISIKGRPTPSGARIQQSPPSSPISSTSPSL